VSSSAGLIVVRTVTLTGSRDQGSRPAEWSKKVIPRFHFSITSVNIHSISVYLRKLSQN